MNSIEIMIEEHRLISRMLKVIRKACYKLLEENQIEIADFYTMIDFVKYYADEHHHNKEEKFLFKAMEEHLGALGQKIIRNGMLVEHDMGRLYMSDLRVALKRYEEGEKESKLDIIANMISYTHLLERHIQKENEVVYTFGEKQLPADVLKKIDELTNVYEEHATNQGIQQKYRDIVDKLEKKYL